MLKRSISLFALLFCMVPMLAFANVAPTKGTISTRVMTKNGTLTIGGATQGSSAGSVSKSYSVGTAIPYTITPDAGYVVSQIIVNGGTPQLNPPLTGNLTIPVVVNSAGNYVATTQSLLVYFTNDMSTTTSVVGSASGNGVVLPSGIQNLTTGASASYIFAPDSGGSVNSISGLPTGAVLTDANLGTSVSLSSAYRGAVKVAFTVPATAVSMVATFSVPTVLSATLPQTVLINTSATLTAMLNTTVAGATYAWAQTSGPGFPATPWTATGASATFTPTVAGVYGFAVTVSASGKALTYPAYTTVTAVTTIAPVLTPAQTGQAQCEDCHSAAGVGAGIFAKWSASIHSNSTHSLCSACHVGTATGAHPGTVNYASVNNTTFQTLVPGVNGFAQGTIMCKTCHSTIPHSTSLAGANTCVQCHTSATGVGGTGDAHQIQGLSCVGCHAVGQTNPFSDKTLVNDNSGVRAVIGEFGKWSHHIVNAPGVALQDEQCAVCHLEGTVGGYGFGVDGTKHMTDGIVHLRNADTDADMQWDPANPNHTTMDNFCMSCHDANGATSAMNLKLQALITPVTGTTASPSNPFGDTISNQYDKMLRPAVVNVSDQFNTTNNSHHGVKGPRYSGRTRVAGASRLITSIDPDSTPGTHAGFANNSSANLPGKRTTIYDAGKFNGLYTPLVNAGGEASPRTGAATLGDDSTLHCGDCHTVGQWKAGSSVTAAGTPTPAVIGAHGSNNEYMLRNSIGTDARHQGIQMDSSKTYPDAVTPYLVCYDCHAIANYGLAAHVGEQVVGENNCNTMTNTNSVNAVGTARLNSQNTYTYGTNVFGTPDGATASNIFGIQCNNCHNSGITAGNIFGGIHGSADATYTDGAGNTTKHERFLPGLGNVMYAPGTRGGITGGTVAYQSYSSAVQKSGISAGQRFKGQYAYTTGGITNDSNWEEKSRIPVGDGVTAWSHNPGAAGCYTITAGPDEVYSAEGNGVPGGPAASKGLAAPAADGGALLFGNWGGCADHSQSQGSSVRQPRSTNTSIRPVTY